MTSSSTSGTPSCAAAGNAADSITAPTPAKVPGFVLFLKAIPQTLLILIRAVYTGKPLEWLT